MNMFHAEAPIERVHLDFLGPLTKSNSGNEFILVIVDQYIKWIECVTHPSQTAQVTAKTAVDYFFSRC